MPKSEDEQSDGRINTGSKDEEHSKIQLQYSSNWQLKYLTVQYYENHWCNDINGSEPGRDRGSPEESVEYTTVTWAVLL